MESVRKVVSEPPRVAAGSGKKKRVISEKQRAAVSAGVKRWHMKQGHKISTERINMQVVDGHATMEKEKAGDKIVVIVTQITPDQPSGSRTATVLLTVAQLEALVAPLGFHPVAA